MRHGTDGKRIQTGIPRDRRRSTGDARSSIAIAKKRGPDQKLDQKGFLSNSIKVKSRKPSQGKKPIAVDLFCGCGGLTEGLKEAGFQVLGAVDLDPLSVEVYKANHPEVKVWEMDIRELDPAELLNELDLKERKIDLLAGCPPCQGFSTMRTLNGAVRVDDPRNDLLKEFERFVEALRPRAVMMENVPGLADDERFMAFCMTLKRLGYWGEHRILNAADYGVPQRRRRLI